MVQSSSKNSSITPFRWSSLLVIVFVALGSDFIQRRLWPWGLAKPWRDRIEYVDVDNENDILRSKHGRLKKIYERVEKGQQRHLKGPETVVFGNDGTMYIMNEEGFLISLTDFEDKEDGITITAKTDVVADLGMGRPLGGEFASDNTLYIADAHLGLVRLKNPGSGSKVELVASRVVDKGNWTQILYANDLAVGPVTGKVYFTDSSEIAPDRLRTQSWDTLYASKLDCLRATKTGRLLEYDPRTDEVKVLARGLHFSNGIAVDKDETRLVFAETFTLRMLKYDLRTHSLSTIVDGGLTGYPDGVDCALPGVTSKSTTLCYGTMPSAIIPLLKLIKKIPHPFDLVLRSLLMSLPKGLAPPVEPYGGIVEFDPENGQTKFIQDPMGKDIGMLTGVTIRDSKLYLGSLKNDFIGVYHLSED